MLIISSMLSGIRAIDDQKDDSDRRQRRDDRQVDSQEICNWFIVGSQNKYFCLANKINDSSYAVKKV